MRIISLKKSLLAFLVTVNFIPENSKACSRVVFTGEDGLVITGRTMDWKEDMKTNIYILPRGVERRGGITDNCVKWRSKYGSIIATGYDIGSPDGMNEKGLCTNMLFLEESEYEKENENRPVLSISLWAQYVLDNFSTVKEAVEQLKKDEFYLHTGALPNGAVAKFHLSISDATGNSAIIEYKNGNAIIYEGSQYNVLTNSPYYNDQLAINNYWKEIGGLNMLPGTNRSSDRFARASFYIDIIPKTSDERIGVAGVMSVIRNVSVPLGISTKDKPNISTTIWRTVSDQKNLKYYYESTLSPNVFWIDLKDIDFAKERKELTLPLTDGQIYAGNAFKDLKKSHGLKFLLLK